MLSLASANVTRHFGKGQCHYDKTRKIGGEARHSRSCRTRQLQNKRDCSGDTTARMGRLVALGWKEIGSVPCNETRTDIASSAASARTTAVSAASACIVLEMILKSFMRSRITSIYHGHKSGRESSGRIQPNVESGERSAVRYDAEPGHSLYAAGEFLRLGPAASIAAATGSGLDRRLPCRGGSWHVLHDRRPPRGPPSSRSLCFFRANGLHAGSGLEVRCRHNYARVVRCIRCADIVLCHCRGRIECSHGGCCGDPDEEQTCCEYR